MAGVELQVTLLLGAGATVADVQTRPAIRRPPLDRGFFDLSKATYRGQVAIVNQYMKNTYGIDIEQGENDSLEAVMGPLYTDLFNPRLEASARHAFTVLLRLFTRRLADTTNTIEPTTKRWLYRIVTHYLMDGIAPPDLTIITFNQDIQVEKSLWLMSQIDRWKRLSSALFNFPACYGISPYQVTAPRGAPTSRLFESPTVVDGGFIRVLKLHGSLNWYSTHNSDNPGPQAMFRPTRRISITRRRELLPNMTYKRVHRSTYTLPVVVPPVSHKSAVLHEELKAVWRQADDALRRSDELVIFGYSCPQLDFESSNLLRRTLREDKARVRVIDPSAAAVQRYIDLIRPSRLYYYPSAPAFFRDL